MLITEPGTWWESDRLHAGHYGGSSFCPRGRKAVWESGEVWSAPSLPAISSLTWWDQLSGESYVPSSGEGTWVLESDKPIPSPFYACVCCCCSVAKSCPTPATLSTAACQAPLSFTIFLQARILEWVAYPFSSGTSWPRNRTRVSWITGGFFISWAISKALLSFGVCSKLTSTELMMPSNHLILCRPLLLLPSIFPSIRVFSNESVLWIKWPKYWSFSVSPSNEYSGLISFRIDWFDLPAVQGTFKSLLWLWVYLLQFFETQFLHWWNGTNI